MITKAGQTCVKETGNHKYKGPETQYFRPAFIIRRKLTRGRALVVRVQTASPQPICGKHDPVNEDTAVSAPHHPYSATLTIKMSIT